MEEGTNKGDLHAKIVRQLSVRTSGSLKSSLSGRSSSRNSPSFRRLNSSRTPRKESKSNSSKFQWIRGNRLVLFLILITLWTYIGFYVQSGWAHNDDRKAEFVGYKSESGSPKQEKDARIAAASLEANTTTSLSKEPVVVEGKKESDLNKFVVSLTKKGRQVSSHQSAPKKTRRRSGRKSRKNALKPKGVKVENRTGEMEDGMIPRRNTSYGLIVGPFGKTEDRVLGWSADKRKGTCDRKVEFARTVWSRSFVLIFHELSMTGAPLSMMELATELLSCGGTVSAVVLSKKGGLMAELDRRAIKVLKDRAELSFKAAMKADLVIAGSAVCSSWIEQYVTKFPAGSSKIVWWIMENRREYFDRSKHMLNQVKMLTFLSESQSKRWLSWCQEEHIHLNSEPMLVPLSVNDELAFVAGIPCSLNTPSFSVENMLEKRNLLRGAVRKEMGLGDNDVLITSLSSINPGKGQRLLLEASLLVAEHNVSVKNFKSNGSLEEKKPSEFTNKNQTTMSSELNTGSLSWKNNQTDEPAADIHQSNTTNVNSKKRKKRRSRLANMLSLVNHTSKSMAQGDHRKLRNLLSDREGKEEQNLKVLIGSIGSKSNKVLYIKTILRFLSQHSSLSKLVLWTPTTTRVASLYAAADVYVINAQHGIIIQYWGNLWPYWCPHIHHYSVDLRESCSRTSDHAQASIIFLEIKICENSVGAFN
ncbi:Capsular polysaccharide biosynthesis glycosyltransferase CapM [Cocos nucifera]|uniref:Capsular polysaccharide biosynthesis glycosyltransferase CapM n=1 Tax=Cocos nucifera TaxID=13894 RepID=A0A8K0I515_COCNU|nr:Capsular polysaccharide biosynthesis glycosyltransferase CapM [Cocos nucifera]